MHLDMLLSMLVYIQWRVVTRTPLDVLASSIADHAPSGKIAGSITKLKVLVSHCFINLLLNIEKLPHYLLHSVTSLDVQLLINIPCEEKIFYKALREFTGLKEFRLHFRDMTVEGMQELAMSII